MLSLNSVFARPIGASLFAMMLCLLASLGNDAFAYEGINECKILKAKMRDQFTQLSLDEPYKSVSERFGVMYDFYENGAVQITSIHADLSDELYEKDIDASVLEGAIVKSINDVIVNSISDDAFKALHNGKSLEIIIEDSDQQFVLKKRSYAEIEVSDIFLDIKTLSSINSSTASFDAVFDLHMTYKDARLLPIATDVAVKIKERYPDSDGAFFCALRLSDFTEKLYLPVVKPDRFTTNIDEIPATIEFHFAPPENEFLCSDEGWGCSEEEKRLGIAYYDTRKKYSGTVYDFYDFKKFPFDKQILRVSLLPDMVENHFAHVELKQAFTGYNVQQTNLENFNDVGAAGDEWNFTEAWAEAQTFYNPMNDQRMPFIAYDYSAERKAGYYVFKLIIPIIFLILLSWVTFFIKVNELNSRVTISIVCFLSLIAYNFVVDDNLPKLNYLTFMDKFILVSYIFSGIPTIQTVFVEYLSVNKKALLSAQIDKFFRFYFLAGYLVMILLVTVSSGLLFSN